MAHSGTTYPDCRGVDGSNPCQHGAGLAGAGTRYEGAMIGSLEDRLKESAKARREYLASITPTCRLIADVKATFMTGGVMEGGVFKPFPLPPEAQSLVDDGERYIAEILELYKTRYPDVEWGT